MTILASSTFDSSAEGWTVNLDADQSWNIFGKPLGSLRNVDLAQGDVHGYRANQTFLGNKSVAYGGKLSWDIYVDFSGRDFGIPDVVISGNNLTLYLDIGLPVANRWNSYNVALDTSAGWRTGSLTGSLATENQIRSVLSNIEQLIIKGEYSSSRDTSYLDNVFLRTAESSVSLNVTPSGISENSTSNFIYTFTRIGLLSNSLTVNFSVGGTATFNSDYSANGASNFTLNQGSVTFAPGATTATITINPTGDTVVEGNETVSLSLISSSLYAISTPKAVTATIINDDGTRRQKGTNGNDVILGTDRADYLTGENGNDTLTGGAGGDIFTFSSPNQGRDSITDFTPNQDSILVSSSGFGGNLVYGDSLKSNQFLIGTTATTSNHRFIYNSATGALLFDRDGTGSVAAIQIATLNRSLNLTNEDIFVS